MTADEPHGLYWLGPLLWSFSVVAAFALAGLAFALVRAVASPRARANRAKLRARR